jgi:histidine ammonia-lyase
MSTTRTIRLGGDALDLEALIALADPGTMVEPSESARRRIAAARAIVDDHLHSGRPVYGLTTGLGSLVGESRSPGGDAGAIAADERRTLLGRVVAIGGPMPRAVARRALGLRLANLALGTSGVSPHVVDALLALYNRGVTPVVSGLGSIGASDLGPCAQMAAVALGVGDAWLGDDAPIPAADALARCGLAPVELAAKDALGLFNAGSVTLARAVELAATLRTVAHAATVAAVASCEALGANPAPFGADVTRLKPWPSADTATRTIATLLEGSWTLIPGAVAQPQHALSFRTLVPTLALLQDHLARFVGAIELEANHSGDNPVVLLDARGMASSAHFHTLHLAVAGDALAIAIAHWAAAAAARTIKLVNSPIDGVPAFLAPEGGLSVGFNALMKATSAMASRVRYEASPASLDALAVSRGAEDVASQAPLVVERLERQVDAWARLTALEAMTAHQAGALRAETSWGLASRTLREALGRTLPVVTHDQPLGHLVDAVHARVVEGALGR